MTTEFCPFLKEYLDSHPISFYRLGHYFQIEGKHLQEQYKERIIDITVGSKEIIQTSGCCSHKEYQSIFEHRRNVLPLRTGLSAVSMFKSLLMMLYRDVGSNTAGMYISTNFH
jgi:hypothetical protein